MGSILYEETLDVAGRLLCLAVRARRSPSDEDELRRLYAQLGDSECLKAAQMNQVCPLVSDVLLETIGESLPSHWAKVRSDNQGRVERLLGALGEVTQALNDAGCRPTVIEAGGTLLGTDLPVSSFCSKDFDLLVDPIHWNEVPKVMSSLGFTRKSRRGRPTNRMEFVRSARDGSSHWFEIAPSPFERSWIPLHHHDRTNVWLDRAIPSRKLPAVRVLAPSDALVLGAMHTSLHSFVRAPGIRLYVDVDRPAHDCDISWDVVLEEIAALGAPRRCFIALILSATLLGTSVPRRVFDALLAEPVRWRTIRTLLEAEGVLANGRPKLGRLQSILLEGLLDQQSMVPWIRSIVFPDADWLLTRYGHTETRMQEFGRHLTRFRAILSQWRPQ